MLLAKRIDYTNVKPNATLREIEELCLEAIELGVRAVCVSPCYVSYARSLVRGEVLISAAIDLPFGSSKIEVKRRAVEEAMADGADEVDYVINIGMLKSGFKEYVVREAQEVLKGARGGTVKAIIETGFLTIDEIKSVSVSLADVGVHFIKTCTGYGPRGVTVEDVKAIKDALKGRAKIKAAGGVRDRRMAEALIDAGADIIGTSTARQLLKP
ncbi:MAG: deoxyribose-phosphate aldolase [Candidatus Nezhaarchaeales archaeon]|nr:MAG: deoxyribose-phosphate aldolase [Candidatus Nezhaarchaeota archaeon WYZ-LMO8]TDA34797.1 MAG: deoxyribose-phosphate aldolase [Candidatus Nezhaarchaeota archaeon WYZ-LMO7]